MAFLASTIALTSAFVFAFAGGAASARAAAAREAIGWDTGSIGIYADTSATSVCAQIPLGGYASCR